MIAIIRITGNAKVRKEIAETLQRLNLRKKYSCVVFANPSKIQLGMLKKVRDFVSYGEINEKIFLELIEKRGSLIDKTKKITPKKVIDELKKGKKYQEINLKPFFRLAPPRGGIDSKKSFGVGRGILGDNKNKINDLITRML